MSDVTSEVKTVMIPRDWKTRLNGNEKRSLAARLTDDPIRNVEDAERAIEREIRKRFTAVQQPDGFKAESKAEEERSSKTVEKAVNKPEPTVKEDAEVKPVKQRTRFSERTRLEMDRGAKALADYKRRA